MKMKKLFNKIFDMLGPWKYIGTKGIYSYYENRITGNRKAYTDFREVDIRNEDLTLDLKWLNKKNYTWGKEKKMNTPFIKSYRIVGIYPGRLAVSEPKVYYCAYCGLRIFKKDDFSWYQCNCHKAQEFIKKRAEE